MNIKEGKGFVGTDMLIAIAAIMIFSGLIISLMYNNFVENTKIKKQALANMYLVEILENISIADYEDVTNENPNIIPADLSTENFDVELEISESGGEKITKKIIATISYQIKNKKYEYSIERIKIKE